MHKPKVTESIKTAVLVVLFTSTVLLLYFFWNNFSLKGSTFSDLTDQSPSELTSYVGETVIPEEISIHFGGGLYTTLNQKDDGLWRTAINQFKEFNMEEVLVEEITLSKYQEVMELQSVCYSFGYELPFASFCEKYGIPKALAYDQIGTMKSLSYSAGSPQNIFIEDSSNGKYYRIAGESDKLGYFADIINSSERSNYSPHYRLGTLVGGKNRTIIPIFVENGLRESAYSNGSFNEQNSRSFAQLFFGTSLDFTRKIAESDGTIIYMYGYGQKVLRLNKDGTAEYKEEPDAGHGTVDFFRALDIAMAFIDGHSITVPYEGSAYLTTNIEGKEKTYLYLQRVTPLEKDKAKGYRMDFGFKTDAKGIYYEEGSAVTVEILGGQVIYYRLDVSLPMGYSMKHGNDLNPSLSEKPMLSVGNILASNYIYISETLKEAGFEMEGTDQETLFGMIAEQVEYMDSGYLRKDKTFSPVWIIRIGGISFYFDLHEGDILGHEKIYREQV